MIDPNNNRRARRKTPSTESAFRLPREAFDFVTPKRRANRAQLLKIHTFNILSNESQRSLRSDSANLHTLKMLFSHNHLVYTGIQRPACFLNNSEMKTIREKRRQQQQHSTLTERCSNCKSSGARRKHLPREK